jgi:outer membrane lipoprotein-sorting protein
MKKMIMTRIAKFTAAGLLLVTVATTQAQTTTNASTDKNTTVKYLGTQDDVILFNVSVENPAGNKFSVIVSDNEGNQIFQQVYNDRKFDKRFRLPKSETGKLTFVVRNFKDASDDVHSFEVSDKVIEDVVVTAVK